MSSTNSTLTSSAAIAVIFGTSLVLRQCSAELLLQFVLCILRFFPTNGGTYSLSRAISESLFYGRPNMDLHSYMDLLTMNQTEMSLEASFRHFPLWVLYEKLLNQRSSQGFGKRYSDLITAYVCLKIFLMRL